ncbi:hypothetical protein [Selenomonas noxia]|uniref:hypothetical protein n=1 Tax=Selenomonas noxia TaxID=135083 RepID=UPI00288037C5|nr:hypothetical protein [Selenomonas noxia]
MLKFEGIDKVPLNAEETEFFDALREKSAHLPGDFHLKRTGGNDFQVWHDTAGFVGRIKLWHEPDVFAVKRTGTQRATRLFSTLEDAETFAMQKGASYFVEKRPGEIFHYMQYCSGEDDSYHLNNPTLKDCIKTIPKWLKYIAFMEKLDAKLDAWLYS